MTRKKIRELGYKIGELQTGDKNCITDVSEVQVGHVTLHHPIGDSAFEYACTGVTAILPHKGNLFQNKVIGASYVLNGYGKSTGLVQVNELGLIESPVMLTNTFAVPAVSQGTIEYLLKENEDIGETTGTLNVVVGECNDSYLNSTRLFPVKPTHAIEAIKNASNKKTKEGAVGAGTGMVCFDYKGGIGSSSRVIKLNNSDNVFTVGCLVLTNFGMANDLKTYNKNVNDELKNELNRNRDGSIIIVLATDMPVDKRQLQRIAKRCGIGLGRTGSHMNNGSGDIVLAFSTAQHFSHYSKKQTEKTLHMREENDLFNAAFKAAAEATEEAIMNSLTYATTTKGRKNRTVKALPYDLLK